MVSSQISLAPLVAPKNVAREIIFPVEATDLPTPTTRDSITEVRAPSLADMLEAGTSASPEVPSLTGRTSMAGILPCSGAASSKSVAIASELPFASQIPAHEMLLMKNSLSTVIHIFKDPEQWPDLDIAIEILKNSAKMARINISILHDSLLRFRDSIASLASAESITIAPEVFEYRKQLSLSKEKASLIASTISELDQEQLSLQEQLKTLTDDKVRIQDRIATLREEISQMELQGHEDLSIQEVKGKLDVNIRSADTEKLELLRSNEMITSLEDKLVGLPDQTKIILEEKSKYDAAQLQLKENLRQFMNVIGITEEL